MRHLFCRNLQAQRILESLASIEIKLLRNYPPPIKMKTFLPIYFRPWCPYLIKDMQSSFKIFFLYFRLLTFFDLKGAIMSFCKMCLLLRGLENLVWHASSASFGHIGLVKIAWNGSQIIIKLDQAAKWACQSILLCHLSKMNTRGTDFITFSISL